MKKIIVIFIVLSLAVCGCATPDKGSNSTQKYENIEIARSGCCSHHGGVCGCDQQKDRIICCDGTLSPSCTCSGY